MMTDARIVGDHLEMVFGDIVKTEKVGARDVQEAAYLVASAIKSAQLERGDDGPIVVNEVACRACYMLL